MSDGFQKKNGPCQDMLEPNTAASGPEPQCVGKGSTEHKLLPCFFFLGD